MTEKLGRTPALPTVHMFHLTMLMLYYAVLVLHSLHAGLPLSCNDVNGVKSIILTVYMICQGPDSWQ